MNKDFRNLLIAVRYYSREIWSAEGWFEPKEEPETEEEKEEEQGQQEQQQQEKEEEKEVTPFYHPRYQQILGNEDWGRVVNRNCNTNWITKCHDFFIKKMKKIWLYEYPGLDFEPGDGVRDVAGDYFDAKGVVRYSPAAWDNLHSSYGDEVIGRDFTYNERYGIMEFIPTIAKYVAIDFRKHVDQNTTVPEAIVHEICKFYHINHQYFKTYTMTPFVNIIPITTAKRGQVFVQYNMQTGSANMKIFKYLKQIEQVIENDRRKLETYFEQFHHESGICSFFSLKPQYQIKNKHMNIFIFPTLSIAIRYNHSLHYHCHPEDALDVIGSAQYHPVFSVAVLANMNIKNFLRERDMVVLSLNYMNGTWQLVIPLRDINQKNDGLWSFNFRTFDMFYPNYVSLQSASISSLLNSTDANKMYQATFRLKSTYVTAERSLLIGSFNYYLKYEGLDKSSPVRIIEESDFGSTFGCFEQSQYEETAGSKPVTWTQIGFATNFTYKYTSKGTIRVYRKHELTEDTVSKKERQMNQEDAIYNGILKPSTWQLDIDNNDTNDNNKDDKKRKHKDNDDDDDLKPPTKRRKRS